MNWIKTLLKPVTNLIAKSVERRMAKDMVQAKVKMAKLNGSNKLEMTDTEWEALSLQLQDSTWKDEFVTVVILFPFISLMLGGIYGSVTGDMSLLEGTKLALVEIKMLDQEYWELTKIVILAAVGLKLWRGR